MVETDSFQGDAPKLHICVINSVPSYVKLCDMILQPEGFWCDTQAESEGLHRHVAESPPQLIITDVRLHDGRDGIAEVESLQAQGWDGGVVVCSAWLDILEKQRPRIEGHGWPVLQMPFEIEDLVLATREAVLAKS